MKFLTKLSIVIGCVIFSHSILANQSTAIGISTCEELQNIEPMLDYELLQDIDCTNIDFEPIGEAANERFSGSLDGNGFTIRDIRIEGSRQTECVGIFQYPINANFKNLVLENIQVSDGVCVGTLLGCGWSNNITNVLLTNGLVKARYEAGLLVGCSDGDVIRDVKVSGSVFSLDDDHGNPRFGGLAGSALSGSGITIYNSHANVNIYAPNAEHVGGLVGSMFAGSIIRSSSSGLVEGQYQVGGLVGTIENGKIQDSYSTSSVEGIQSVGGLIGENQTADVVNTYSTGKVQGKEFVGGLIGKSSTFISDTNYWDMETSGQYYSEGGSGRTTQQMFQSSNYVDWNFLTVWEIDEGNNYPLLQKNSEPLH